MKIQSVALTEALCVESMTVTLSDAELALVQALLYGTADEALVEVSGDVDAPWHALQIRSAITTVTDRFQCRDVG